ncbi:hypothetical protein WNY37_04350 [Henriciella sp. AS95]
MTRTRKILRRRKMFRKMKKDLQTRMARVHLTDAGWPAGQITRSPV